MSTGLLFLMQTTGRQSPWCFSQQVIHVIWERTIHFGWWMKTSSSCHSVRSKKHQHENLQKKCQRLERWSSICSTFDALRILWENMAISNYSQKKIQEVRPKMWRNLEITIFKLISPFLYMHKCSYNRTYVSI